MRALGRLAVAALLTLAPAAASAYDGIVEKRVFELPSYTTVGGKTIAPVRIGWESYGTLAPNKDNVVLITHFFSGTSHAAGKYSAEDKAAGYWDAIIGPGKPIDTDRFFVISSDTLVNLNAKDPKVVTTGPASINPATGKPWGTDFPIVTIRDFVNVQKALLESLGIRKLHAVIGASMGAMQALEWAAAYPDMVERVIPVIGAGEADAWLIGWLDIWDDPIELDPNWKNGAYYGGPEPVEGLTRALKIVTLHAQHPRWAASAAGRKAAAEGRNPAESLANEFAIESILDKAARARAAVSDANHFLYLVKANQLYVAGHAGALEEGLKRIKAPMLLLPAAGDLVLFPEMSRRVQEIVTANGGKAELVPIEGDRGHLDGLFSIAKVGPAIADFLRR